MKTRYIGLFAIITLVSGIVLAQEFSIEVYDMHPTSVRFEDPGYTPDATRRVHILENTCVGGIYDVSAFPIDYSAPDGSTPPLTNPSTWLSKTKGELDTDDSIGFILNDGGRFNFAGVGQYRMEAMLSQGLLGGQLSGCTEGMMIAYTVTIEQPALPPSTGSDTGSGSELGTGDDTDDEESVIRKGGAGSSISIEGGNTDGIHQSAFQTQSANSEQDTMKERAVCQPVQLIRSRMYDIANQFARTNILSLKEMIRLTALKQRYLAKANSPKERNALIEKGFCVTTQLEEKTQGTDTYRLIRGFQDMILLEYDFNL